MKTAVRLNAFTGRKTSLNSERGCKSIGERLGIKERTDVKPSAETSLLRLEV